MPGITFSDDAAGQDQRGKAKDRGQLDYGGRGAMRHAVRMTDHG